jgi:hypothetical protein
MSIARFVRQMGKHANAPAQPQEQRERGIAVPATLAAAGALTVGNPMSRLHETLDGMDFHKRRDALLAPHQQIMTDLHTQHSFTPSPTTTPVQYEEFMKKLAPAERTGYATAENEIARINSTAGQRWGAPLRTAAGLALTGYGLKKVYDTINHNAQLRAQQSGTVKAASAGMDIHSGLGYMKYVVPSALAGGALGAMSKDDQGETSAGRIAAGTALGAATGLGVRQLAAARQFHNLSKEEKLLFSTGFRYEPGHAPTAADVKLMEKTHGDDLPEYYGRLVTHEVGEDPQALMFRPMPKDWEPGTFHYDIDPRHGKPLRMTGKEGAEEYGPIERLNRPLSLGDAVATSHMDVDDELRKVLTDERNRRAIIGGVGTAGGIGAGAYAMTRRRGKDERQSGTVKAASVDAPIRSGLGYMKYMMPGALAGGAIGAVTGEEDDGRGWMGAALGAATGLGVRQLAAARQFHNLSKEKELLHTQARRYTLEGIPMEDEIAKLQKQFHGDTPQDLANRAGALGHDGRTRESVQAYQSVPKDSTLAPGHWAIDVHPRRAEPIRVIQDGKHLIDAKQMDYSFLPMGDVMRTQRVGVDDDLRKTLTDERNRRALIGGVGTAGGIGAGAYAMTRRREGDERQGGTTKSAEFSTGVRNLHTVVPGALIGGALGAMSKDDQGETSVGRIAAGTALGALGGYGVAKLRHAKNIHDVMKGEHAHMERHTPIPSTMSPAERQALTATGGDGLRARGGLYGNPAGEESRFVLKPGEAPAPSITPNGTLIDSTTMATKHISEILAQQRNAVAGWGGGALAVGAAGLYGMHRRPEQEQGGTMKAAGFTSWVFPRARFG